ncbi:MAG: HD domain-containing protein [Eubacterium sp.]|nr:HD domain-containing protein [Eubacterium sp.]
MRIRLPATVKLILDRLHTNGFEAYVVGGCVRDSILGRNPDDWDVTTSALPAQVKRLFHRTVDTGLQHGTVTVIVGSRACEVTTYRIDGTYTDSRHPDNVTFASSLSEDLRRRDFTINAMAYNEKEGLIDLYGGMKDLQRKKICCVGDAAERFSEDALRIMRAVRFSAQLHFGIDRLTALAMMDQVSRLKNVSAERICSELLKLICSDHPEYLKVAYEVGITRIVLPEFDAMMETAQNSPYHQYNVGDHTLAAMQNIYPDKVLRLTMLLHDTGKPLTKTTDEFGTDHFKKHAPLSEKMAVDILSRLKLDNDTIDKVRVLVKYHDWRINPFEKEVRHALYAVSPELFPYLMAVQRADTMAKSSFMQKDRLNKIDKVEQLALEILERKDPIGLKDLAINGKDLLSLGIPAGPQIGDMLKESLDFVLDDPKRNEKELLLSHLKLKPQTLAAKASGSQTSPEAEISESQKSPKAEDSETKIPETTDPDIKDSGITDPETTAPETEDSETTDSESNNSEITDPETENTETVVPDMKDSGIKDPESNDSEITDPETEDPKAESPEIMVSELQVSETEAAETQDSSPAPQMKKPAVKVFSLHPNGHNLIY